MNSNRKHPNLTGQADNTVNIEKYISLSGVRLNTVGNTQLKETPINETTHSIYPEISQIDLNSLEIGVLYAFSPDKKSHRVFVFRIFFFQKKFLFLFICPSSPSPLWGEGGDKGKYKKIKRQIPVLNESKSTVEAAELLNPLNYKDSSAKGRNLNFIVRYINREKLVVNELGSFYFVKTVIQYYRYVE